MAVSPILLNSIPFDALLEHTLEITYTGSQIFANRVIIRNNLTNSIVYNVKTSSMTTSIKIPANTLVNGNTYNFQVSVFDYQNIESPLSNIVILKCLKTPSFSFSNITEGLIIRNSGIEAEIAYTQDNGELLNAYTVYLYDSNKSTLIFTSELKYANATLKTNINGLIDDNSYYIRATGETLNGMEIDTGYIQINCDYIKPDIFLKFRADNLEKEGSVRLSSNFVLIEGRSNPESLIFVDNEKVSLLNGETVWLDKGYEANDFVFEALIENIPDFVKIISFDMQNAKADVTWNYGYFENESLTPIDKKYYAELTAYQYIGTERLNYIRISNRINPLLEGEQVHIWIKHVSGKFDIIIEKVIAGGGD